jgi:hypothetical protein
MGRDGALLPHRSHGESGPASRSYDKTSQLDSHRFFGLPHDLLEGSSNPEAASALWVLGA